MTQIANADLLDESVSNVNSLKKDRINRTAQTASNPNPVSKRMVEKESNANTNDDEDDYEEESRGRSSTFNKSNDAERGGEEDDDKKILGMNPVLFYSLVGAVVLVGGYFAYKKFKGKSVGKVAGTGAGASTITGTGTSTGTGTGGGSGTGVF